MPQLNPGSLTIFARLLGFEMGRTEDGLEKLKEYKAGPHPEMQEAEIDEIYEEGKAFMKDLIVAEADLKSFVKEGDSKVIPLIILSAKAQVKGMINHGLEKN